MVKQGLAIASERTCDLARFLNCPNHEKQIMLMGVMSFIAGMAVGYIIGICI